MRGYELPQKLRNQYTLVFIGYMQYTYFWQKIDKFILDTKCKHFKRRNNFCLYSVHLTFSSQLCCWCFQVGSGTANKQRRIISSQNSWSPEQTTKRPESLSLSLTAWACEQIQNTKTPPGVHPQTCSSTPYLHIDWQLSLLQLYSLLLFLYNKLLLRL